MAKQIYIDSNGNEILLSGTINRADMLPYDDNKSTADAIGDLDDINTTVKSSTVGAINSVNTVYGGTIVASTGYTMTAQRLVKQGRTVMMSAVINADTPITASRRTIANIPEGFRPPNNVNLALACSGQTNGFSNRFLTGLITSGGDIMVGDMLLPAGESVKEVRISICYEQYY